MISEITVPSPQKHFRMMKDGVIPHDLQINNNGRIYNVHAVVVSALSEKLLESVTEMGSNRKPLELKITDDYDVLSQIIDFCYGFDLTITPANCDSVYLIATLLRISALIESSAQCVEKSLTIASVVPSLLFLFNAGGPVSIHLQFIRDNFNEILYNDDVISLPFEVLDAILSSDEFGIDDEDQLAMWVSKVIQVRGTSCKGLVDRLHLGNLSDKSILELCAREEIEAHILLDKARKEKAKPDGNVPKRHFRSVNRDVDQLIRSNNELSISLPEDKSVDGLISYIVAHQNSGINEIRLDVSSTHLKYFSPRNVLDTRNMHSCWYSSGSPNQWILYDFSPRLMKPTCYTIRTSGANKGEGHLRSWKVTASNDNRTWIQIDERRDIQDLNGNYNACTFSCDCSDFFRMFKITQIDVNWHKDHSMILSCCEFFGQMVPKDLTEVPKE